MKFRWRKALNVLPFAKVNINQSGAASITWHALGWSYNTRTGQHRFNPPGPGTFVGRTRRQRARR